MSEQPSTWPPPKRKSYGWLFGVGIALFVLAKFALVFGFVMYSQGLARRQASEKNFEDLNSNDRSMLQYDSVQGDYMEWAGEELGTVYLMGRRLVIDESGKFATRSIFHVSGISDAPVDTNFSGRWSETNGVLTLKFYYPPEKWTDVFDTLKNDTYINIIDHETIELSIQADTIWMNGIPCVKKQE